MVESRLLDETPVSVDWGVPDWRIDASYPAENTSLNMWQWQFTRRRPDYRDEWHKYKGETYERYLTVHGADKTLRPEDKAFRVDIPGSLRKYGLLSCPNPAFSKPIIGGDNGPVFIEFEKGGHFISDITDEPRMAKVFLDSMCLAVSFDLSMPLAEQLERVRKNLEVAQQRRKGPTPSFRRHTAKWATYLRVIDARDAGQTWDVIAREILRYNRDDAPAGRQVWEQAHNLMFNFPS